MSSVRCASFWKINKNKGNVAEELGLGTATNLQSDDRGRIPDDDLHESLSEGKGLLRDL